MVRDQAGLTHVAVPLLLGKRHLGAIIAGQVFDRYPEPLPLRRVAKEYGVSAQQLWDVARKQRPVSSCYPPGLRRFALCAGSCISPATLWRDSRGEPGGDKQTFSIAGRGD